MDIVAREGLEATTLNRIARQLGASIRVITHYFSDKDALLLELYRIMATRGRSHLLEVLERDPADLPGVLIAMCGADNSTLDRWRVYIAFWDKAARSQEFAAEQQKWIEEALSTISEVIVARTGTQANVRHIATELIALVYGISIQRILDPASWTPTAIASAIHRQTQKIEEGICPN